MRRPRYFLVICVLCIHGIIIFYARDNRRYDLFTLNISTESPPEAVEGFTILNTVEDFNEPPIDVFSVINGACAIREAVTMLKSMLYFHGNIDKPNCQATIQRPSEIQCPKRNRNRKSLPLRIHWLTWACTKSRAIDIFKEWRPRNLLVQIYDMERYLKYLDYLPIKHYAGVSAMNKMIVPYILPRSVEKVIIMDVDSIFNDDILHLWEHFKAFKPGQMIGAACEQVRNCPAACSKSGDPFPEFGINSGMMLMDLKEMRLKDWWTMWQAEAQKELRLHGHLPIADQKVISDILKENRQLFYPLPCEWNVQVHIAEGIKCCPIQWIEHTSEEDAKCVDTVTGKSMEPARLVHYNIQLKPVVYGPYVRSQLEWSPKMELMSLKQLRHRFTQMYDKFSRISFDCFE